MKTNKSVICEENNEVFEGQLDFLANLEKKYVISKDEKPLKGYRFIDLFAGIGGIRIPFDELGAKCVFTSEWDKFSQQTYEKNFGKKPSGDITQIRAEEIPSFDILLAGFPCQPFSFAGHKKGFEDTRGTLFFDICRIVEYRKPKILFLENVKGFKNHNKGNTFKTVQETLDNLGYKVHSHVLNSKNFALPQNRERFFMIAFRKDLKFNFVFPLPKNKKVQLGDILERQVEEKYTISDKLWAGHQRRKLEHKAKGIGFGYSMFNHDSEYTSTLSARYYKDGSEVLIEQENKNPRKLSPREAGRLQGFPNDFKIVVSDTQAYKQFGNSVAVPVIEELAKNIYKYINK